MEREVEVFNLALNYDKYQILAIILNTRLKTNKNKKYKILFKVMFVKFSIHNVTI